MRQQDNFELPDYVREYVDLIVQRLRPLGIILFGSMATGEAHRTSDYDLLVVAQNLPLDVWERIDVLWRDKPLDVEVIGFRPKEIEEKIHRGLVLDALLLGRVLYGNVSGLQEKARHFVGEKKLVRTEAGYFREREARGE